MRRAVVAWLIVVAFALAAGTGAVAALNATAFGAAGFVRVYLEALQRGDTAGALSMAGVTVDPGLRDDFLVDDALAAPTVLREISVAPGDDGTEVVTVAWTRGETDGAETDAVSVFTVERTGSRLGLFPEWAFAVSPVATLRLTIAHDHRFDVNGVPAATTGVEDYAVLVPGVYRVDHHSRYLEADALDLVVDRPASVVAAGLEVRPAAGFLDAITAQVHAGLDDCVTQQVLFPTGCPMGRAIVDRVVSAPEWSIVEYPDLTVEPGVERRTWLVADVALVAHLSVDVRSIFDGGISTLEEDIPVTATYLVTIEPDDSTLRIELR